MTLNDKINKVNIMITKRAYLASHGVLTADRIRKMTQREMLEALLAIRANNLKTEKRFYLK